jgi:hypothetical protein
MSITPKMSLFDSVRINFSPSVRSMVSILKTPTWVLRGRPHPSPPHLKRRTVLEFAKRQKFEVFIETGTYRGDMLARVSKKSSIKKILSIELDETLAIEAQFRFRTNSRIEILKGDSGEVLRNACVELPQPALFWLDGHFSGGVTALGDTTTPIFAELQAIHSCKRKMDLILVDDIRLFNGTDGYPTLEELIEVIHKLNPEWQCKVQGDILTIS